MADLDLESGDPNAAEQILKAGTEAREARRGRGRPKGSTNAAKQTRSSASTEAEDKTLFSRLVTAFNDLGDAATAREDAELADILYRRKEAMAQGLVGLTRNIRFLRGPLVLLINFLEPTLAFWELGGLVTRRAVARRQRKMYEQQTGMTVDAEAVDIAG